MSKYPAGQRVGAVYDGTHDNPYLAALPDMLSPDAFARAVASYPSIPYSLAELSSDERRSLLPSLASIYVPMPYQYAIYDTLYRAISTTFLRNKDRKSLSSFRNKPKADSPAQGESLPIW